MNAAQVGRGIPAAPPSADSPLNAFQGAVAPSALSWMYRIGLGAVAFAMVLLPAVYIALIGFTSWGVYWHASANLWLLQDDRGNAGFVQIVGYAAPIVMGVLLVAFMVKPFFAKRATPPLAIPLQRDAEPLLFQFVDRVCGLVGAPAPALIQVNCDVNAFASFRKGLRSFTGNDLVLTIGLPLVAGLNMRQFAGVLAHEFGHFAQGAGMRLTYIIRQVNNWFARVVYERDQWDMHLESLAKSIDLRVGAILHAARAIIWLTRKILWALMHVGNAISCFMLRQMEFDADSYECKLSGSDTFAETTVRIQTLNLASHQAYGDLSESWRSGRLPDNFAAFVQHKAAVLPAELRGKIQEDIGKRKTRAFDTHPADGDRIKAAQAVNAPGVFRLEDAAAGLFANFPNLSRCVTREFYEKHHQLPVTDQSLVPTEESVKESRENDLLDQTLQRYFFGSNVAVTSIKLTAPQCLPLPDWKSSVKELEAARQKAGEMKDAVKPALEKYDAAEARWIRNFNARALRQAEFTLKAGAFGVTTTSIPGLETALSAVSREMQEIETTLQPFSDTIAARLAAALQLLNHADFASESLAPLKAESAAVLELFSGLSEVLDRLHQIRRRLPALEVLLQNRPHHQQFAKVDAIITPLIKTLQTHLDAIHTRLKDVPYPYAHVRGRITVSQFAHARDKYKHEVEAAYIESHAAVDRLFPLYFKAAGRLASTAEAIEERIKSSGSADF